MRRVHMAKLALGRVKPELIRASDCSNCITAGRTV